MSVCLPCPRVPAVHNHLNENVAALILHALQTRAWRRSSDCTRASAGAVRKLTPLGPRRPAHPPPVRR